MVLTQKTKVQRPPSTDVFKIEYRSRKEWVLHDKYTGELSDAKAYFKYTATHNKLVDWRLCSSVGVVESTQSSGLADLI